MSAIETGAGARPGAAILNRIAGALGVTLADLFGRRIHATSPQAIPDSLTTFARERGLPEADISMLAKIQFRGEQPQTTQRWTFIYDAIKNSAGQEDRGLVVSGLGIAAPGARDVLDASVGGFGASVGDAGDDEDLYRRPPGGDGPGEPVGLGCVATTSDAKQ